MSPFRRFVVVVAAVVVVVLTPTAPASAHDELISSNPAANAELDAAPTSVSLEFSADVMDVGALVMVADAAGADWAAGEPMVQSSHVTVPLRDDLPVGGFEVRWRVVSSDGHPISGVIPFTVGDAEPLPREAVAGGDADAGGDANEPREEAESQSAQENEGVLRVVLIGVAGAAVAVAVLVGIHFLRRRRTAGDADDSGAQARRRIDL